VTIVDQGNRVPRRSPWDVLQETLARVVWIREQFEEGARTDASIALEDLELDLERELYGEWRAA